MKLFKDFPKKHLSLPLTVLAAVLLAGAITLLALWCQPNALRDVLGHMKAQPLLIVLNAMPVGLLLLAFTCLFRNVFYSAALTNFVVCGLSIANRIKIEVRDEPVFPRDLGLLKEAGSAMSSYHINFPVTVIAVVIVATLLLVLLGLFVDCAPFPIARLRGWMGRILGTAASLAVLAGLILTVYASNRLYNSFRVSNPYYVPAVFNELGFPYCFCHQFTTYPVDKPAGFNKSQAQTWEAEAVQPTEAKPVNVIIVMNEAFSDVPDAKGLHFPEEPLPNLQSMRQDPHAVTGHLVVPGFAGGTANTEFDVLTGIQTNALSATTTSSMRVVNRNLDSLFRLYGADGYHTSYFHPGDDWFYNRENVMQWMGAEETRFVDEMPDLQYKGRWVTDACLVNLIQQEFEDTMAAGQNLFHYITTIQNHMSYTSDKYGADYPYPPLETDLPLSDNVRSLLEVYTEGARDADAMLGALRDYFATRSEPVVLVYYGDHLPYLGDNQQAYVETGLADQEYWSELHAYETPFVIWANDAAYNQLDWSKTASIPDQISACFLGAAVADLTGHTGSSAWFTFLNQLRQQTPVIQKQTAVLADGTVLVEDGVKAGSSTGGNIPETIQKWRQWSYYKLKYQEFSK